MSDPHLRRPSVGRTGGGFVLPTGTEGTGTGDNRWPSGKAGAQNRPPLTLKCPSSSSGVVQRRPASASASAGDGQQTLPKEITELQLELTHLGQK